MNIRTRTETVIDVGDWDQLVIDTYGKIYSFQQQDGCKSRGKERVDFGLEEPDDYENDTVPEEINGDEMGVSFAAWLARDPEEWNGKEEDRSFLRLFWNRNFYPTVESIGYDLVKRGLIEAGSYTIDIDW